MRCTVIAGIDAIPADEAIFFTLHVREDSLAKGAQYRAGKLREEEEREIQCYPAVRPAQKN